MHISKKSITFAGKSKRVNKLLTKIRPQLGDELEMQKK